MCTICALCPKGFRAAKSKAGFLKLGSINILSWMSLCRGGCVCCLVRCRVFSTIAKLYSVDASNEKRIQTFSQMYPWGQNLRWWKTADRNQSLFWWYVRGRLFIRNIKPTFFHLQRGLAKVEIIEIYRSVSTFIFISNLSHIQNLSLLFLKKNVTKFSGLSFVFLFFLFYSVLINRGMAKT